MIDLFLHAAILTTTPILLAAIGGLRQPDRRPRQSRPRVDDAGRRARRGRGVLGDCRARRWRRSRQRAIGALVGLAMSLVVTRLRANEIIVGLGFTVAVAGLVRFLLKSIYGVSGTYNPPGVAMLPRLDIPFLDGVPIVGRDPFAAGRFDVVRLGDGSCSRLRADADALGTEAARDRRGRGDGARSRAGAARDPRRLDGLRRRHGRPGRARYLSIGIVGLFNEGITGGRGFIALAAFYFGRNSPARTAFGALLFGFFDAAQIRLQGRGVPAEIVQTLPYVIVIVVLTGLGVADWRASRERTL